MTRKKRLITLFSVLATVFLAAAIFALCFGRISARADVYQVATESLTFERLTPDNANTEKVMRNAYLELYGVPTSKFTYTSNGGEQSGAPLTSAFDRNFSSIWRSGKQWDSKRPTETVIDVTVVFNTPTEVDRILYQADCGWYNRGSFTKARFSYVPEGDTSFGGTMSEDTVLKTISEVEVQQTSDTYANLITFREPVTAWAIKIEWLAVHTGHLHCAAASEIVFLQPERDEVKAVQTLFSDYNQLHLSDSKMTKERLDELRSRVTKYASYDTELSYLLDRAEQVLNGKVQYDVRREMGTDPKSGNVLQRRGDIAGYARSTLKMAWFGTNRQATGVSVAPGEELIVYVDGKEGDPLPSLVVTQFWGAWSSWRSGEYKLSLGKNIIRPNSYLQPGFTTNDGQALPAGGPVYLTNPYISEELLKEEPQRTEKVQSDQVKVYFEGGTLFPIYRIGGDELLYKKYVSEYAAEVQRDRKEADEINNDLSLMLPHRDYKVVDVTEIVSENIIITVRATAADLYYNERGVSPQEACLGWDKYVKELLRSDGVILEKNDPNIEKYRGKYDPRAKWLNCNIRLMQPYGAAYAHIEHVGIQVSWEGGALTGASFGWGYTHELGHMMDIGERTVSECSNNMLSKYDETVMTKVATRGDFAKTTQALAPDVRAESSYWNTNRGNFIFWWLIESFQNGWWPRLENLYRYYDIYKDHRDEKNNLLVDAINSTEKQVLLASISFGYDLSYYFERWGYNLSSNDPVFSAETASPTFRLLMEEAKANGSVKREDYRPKIWYADAAEWWARHDDGKTPTKIYDGKGTASIEAVTKGSAGYSLLLRSDKMKDPSHLGFEIWEGEGQNAKVIAFTTDSVFLDSTQYENGYLPVYSVVAYDRALTCSGRSKEVALKELAPVCRIGEVRYTSLYDAYMAAKSEDTIVLLEDCYMGGLTVEAGKTLTIATEGKACTLSRGGAGVMFSVEAGGKLILRGQSNAPLTIDGLGYEQDSALVRTFGSLDISHCVLRNNHIRFSAKKGGGAIDIATGNEAAAIRISDTRFENNSSYLGGAICFAGGVNRTIENCTFVGNRAVEGGALYINNGVRYVTTQTISGSSFENNVAEAGGLSGVTPKGGAIVTANWYANVKAEDLTFKGNEATLGGALYLDSESFTGNKIVFEGNVATEEGGAVYFARKGWTNNMNWNNLSLTKTTVTGTKCERGAALYLRSNSTLGLTLGENDCSYAIHFAEGSFALPGGEWQGNVFLAKIARLTARESFPAVPAGKEVHVETDSEEVGGTFIAASGFQGQLGDEEGFTAEGGDIAFDNNSLVFALKTVEVTFSADGNTVTNKYIVGRTFVLPLAFENATKYMLSWTDDKGKTYEPGIECVAERDITFTAEVKNKAVVKFVYPRDGLSTETAYYIHGETISLPKLDLARNAEFEKYDLTGWKLRGSEELYQPFASIVVDRDLTFEAQLTDKLCVRYLVRPYEEVTTYAARADSNYLIATYYYSFGETLRFARTDEELPQEYLPTGAFINTYVTADGQEIDFSNYTVTQNLDLYAVVVSQPIVVFYTYLTQGGSKIYEGVTTPFDYVLHGASYTISIAQIPYGYHITEIRITRDQEEIGNYTKAEEIEGFRIAHADAELSYGIIVNIEPNEYTVTYKYNDSSEVGDVRRETKKFGDVITLKEPTDLPAGYRFNSYQLGKKVLAMNEDGIYVETDSFVDINFDENGEIKVEVSEDTVINILVSIDPELTISESSLEFMLGTSERAQLTATAIDTDLYTLVWDSSAPEIVSVDGGALTALEVGRAKITVSAYRGRTFITSRECLVTVRTPSTLKLTPEETHVYFDGTEFTLSVTATAEETDYTVEWRSEAPDVATVDEHGTVTVHGVGEAVITATYSKGGVELGSATCTVRVSLLEVESLSLDTENVKTAYTDGDTLDLSGLVVTAHYNDKSSKVISSGYTADKTVLHEGDTTVTVTYGGKSATFAVTVTKASGEPSDQPSQTPSGDDKPGDNPNTPDKPDDKPGTSDNTDTPDAIVPIVIGVTAVFVVLVAVAVVIAIVVLKRKR